MPPVSANCEFCAYHPVVAVAGCRYPATKRQSRVKKLFIDVHTHLDQYVADELPGVLQRAGTAGVGTIIVAGVTVESSRRALELSDANPALFAAVGVHPQEISGPLTQAELRELDLLAANELVVAVSEVGLDYQPSSPPRELQEQALRQQIELARAHGLPVIWHMREATADCLKILSDERVGDLGGVAHYFQGSYDEAAAVVGMGCKISLAKPLLRLPELQDVASRLPLGEIVLETDAFPQPFKKNRARWTEPKDIPAIAGGLAELRGMDVEEVMRATTANTLAVLGNRASALSDRTGGALV